MEQSARCARALNRHVSRIYRSQRLARQRFSIARRIPPEKLPENGTIRGGEGVLQDARDRRRPRTHLVAYSCSDNTANLKARVGFIALAAPPGSYASRGQPTPSGSAIYRTLQSSESVRVSRVSGRIRAFR